MFLGKDDLIAQASALGSFELSICKGTEDCCVMFQPAHPVLNADLATAQAQVQLVEQHCKATLGLQSPSEGSNPETLERSIDDCLDFVLAATRVVEVRGP